MVKVSAPALSIDASGTLANSMVFSKWKGRNYVRSHVMPSQPRTGSQVGVRAMFKFLSKHWTNVATVDRATWDALAKAASTSPFNQYMKANQARWRNFLAPSEAHPAAEASTAPSAPTGVATAGVRQISLALTHGANAANFGMMIFRGTAAPTPAFSNCVQVVAVNGAGDATWVDTPLEPGTYHYKAIGFMKDGKIGTASADIQGTVT